MLMFVVPGKLHKEHAEAQMKLFQPIQSPADFKAALDNEQLGIRVIEHKDFAGGRGYSVHDLFTLTFWVTHSESIAWPYAWFKSKLDLAIVPLKINGRYPPTPCCGYATLIKILSHFPEEWTLFQILHQVPGLLVPGPKLEFRGGKGQDPKDKDKASPKTKKRKRQEETEPQQDEEENEEQEQEENSKGSEDKDDDEVTGLVLCLALVGLSMSLCQPVRMGASEEEKEKMLIHIESFATKRLVGRASEQLREEICIELGFKKFHGNSWRSCLREAGYYVDHEGRVQLSTKDKDQDRKEEKEKTEKKEKKKEHKPLKKASKKPSKAKKPKVSEAEKDQEIDKGKPKQSKASGILSCVFCL